MYCMKYLTRSGGLFRFGAEEIAVRFLVRTFFPPTGPAKIFLDHSFSSPHSFTSFDFSHDVQTKFVLSCLVPRKSCL